MSRIYKLINGFDAFGGTAFGGGGGGGGGRRGGSGGASRAAARRKREAQQAAAKREQQRQAQEAREAAQRAEDRRQEREAAAARLAAQERARKQREAQAAIAAAEKAERERQAREAAIAAKAAAEERARKQREMQAAIAAAEKTERERKAREAATLAKDMEAARKKIEFQELVASEKEAVAKENAATSMQQLRSLVVNVGNGTYQQESFAEAFVREGSMLFAQANTNATLQQLNSVASVQSEFKDLLAKADALKSITDTGFRNAAQNNLTAAVVQRQQAFVKAKKTASTHVNDDDGIDVGQLDKNEVYIIGREVDVPGAGVLGKQHSASLFWDQTEIKWRTLAGYNDGDVLASKFDEDAASSDGMVVMATVEYAGSRQDYVTTMINNDSKYKDDMEYDAFPDNGITIGGKVINEKSRNCNSYTAGLHNASGGTLNNFGNQNVNDMIGIDKPLIIN